jgi:hypothetical protein
VKNPARPVALRIIEDKVLSSLSAAGALLTAWWAAVGIGGAIMRYKPKNIAALRIALGGLPDKMRVEADRGIVVSAKTVGDLRKLTTWPENLVITTPQERQPDSVVKISKAGIATHWPAKR